MNSEAILILRNLTKTKSVNLIAYYMGKNLVIKVKCFNPGSNVYQACIFVTAKHQSP